MVYFLKKSRFFLNNGWTNCWNLTFCLKNKILIFCTCTNKSEIASKQTQFLLIVEAHNEQDNKQNPPKRKAKMYKQLYAKND